MRKGYKVSVSLNKKPFKKLEKKKTIKKEEITEKNLSKGIDILNSHKKKQYEIRQGRIGKTLIEVQDELIEKREYKKEEIKKRKRFNVFVILLVIVLLTYLFFTYGPIFGISIFKNDCINEESKIDITSSDSDIYDKYCDELLVYNNKNISTYNSRGSKTWDYELQEIFTPSIYVTGKYMVIANKTNSTIYMFENKKEIFTKKIEGNISHVYINDDGNFAIEYSTGGHKKVVSVYSKRGKLIYNTYLEVSSIIDIKFFEGTKKLLIASSNTNSFNIGCELNIVEGGKETDNIKKVANFENNLIYDMVIKNNNVIVKLDNKIVNCSLSTGNIEVIRNFEESQSLFNLIAENYYMYVDKKLGENTNKYNINLLRFDNSLIATLEDSSTPKYVENANYLNYLVYQDKLKVINKWGLEIKNIELNFPPKDIVVFDKDKCCALIYSNKIYFVKM